jgi:hypothetical protein
MELRLVILRNVTMSSKKGFLNAFVANLFQVKFLPDISVMSNVNKSYFLLNNFK